MGMTMIDMLTNVSHADDIQNIAYSKEDIIWLYNERVFESKKFVVGNLVIMSVFGTFGNGSVVYIYGCRFKRNTINFYILLLAIFDMISSILLSMEAIDRRYSMYTGNFPVLCKTIRLTEFVVNAWSIGVITCIAFDRYYKICRPMKSFTMSNAKKLLAVAILVGCVCLWPIALFHGPETFPTGIQGIHGKNCADDDNFKDLVILPLFYIFLVVLNFAVFVLLVIMYSLLYKEIWKWKHTKVGEDVNKMEFRSVRSISACADSDKKDTDMVGSQTADVEVLSTRIQQNLNKVDSDVIINHLNESFTFSDKTTDVTIMEENRYACTPDHTSEGVQKSHGQGHASKLTTTSLDLESEYPFQSSARKQDNITQPSTVSDGQSTVMRSIRNKSIISKFSASSMISTVSNKFSQELKANAKHSSAKSSANLANSTFMFSIITVAYIISYMPFLITEILHAAGLIDFVNEGMSLTSKQMLRLANSSFCINTAINPIIYSILNPAFRKEVKRIFIGN